jgi:superfamily I DNA/RNA helicase
VPLFLIGVDRLFRPADGFAISHAEAADRREDHARRLYMAMTRAAQRLVLIACERLPLEIEALFDIARP